MNITDNDLIRFANKVQFPNDNPENIDSCWFWQGAKHSRNRGYGKFRLNGRVMNAHKAAYLMFRGEVADGLVLGHQCNCESCCNPFHLEAQSQSANMQYCVQSGRHSSQLK
jgi:hypothetical protein